MSSFTGRDTPYDTWKKRFPVEAHTFSEDDVEDLDITPWQVSLYDVGPTEVKVDTTKIIMPEEYPNWEYDGELVKDETTGGMKGRKDCELFTAPPYGLEEYGKVCSYGSRDKYSQNNWRYGFVWSLSANALLRHYLAWVGGEDIDPESGLHHMAHAAWHSLVLVQFSKDHPDKDDRFLGPAHPGQ